MLHPLDFRQTLQFASTWLVVVAGWIIGHAAAQGMEPQQWAAAAVAILGAVTLAAVAHAKPQAARQRN